MKENTLNFNLNVNVYPLEAIYQTSYVFLDRAYIYLDSPSSKRISVLLKGKKKISSQQLKALKGEFINELLNSSLRLEVSKRSRKIRELIVGRALVSAVQPPKEASFKKDTLAIATPWEEKYGKKAKRAKKTKKRKKKK